ncbi:hypothetical protein LR48_Vigan03g162800 [Vigna angularis]|uniref:Uncharacterized protein n=1 Tax=Phaseolus angularis TaxID=3914 RepID=A0A0L9U652_PHAAN|nr:hypothetical protein LR48_Vigan03g162800 [Vigna angularis]
MKVFGEEDDPIAIDGATTPQSGSRGAACSDGGGHGGSQLTMRLMVVEIGFSGDKVGGIGDKVNGDGITISL